MKKAVSLFLISILLILISACEPSSSTSQNLQTDTEGKIYNLIHDWRQLSDVDTTLVAIESPDLGNIVVISGNLSQDTPMEISSSTPFSIYSINKTFIAAAILFLEQDGLLSLDDPISKYIPTLPHGDEILIENLLNHTSGYPDYDLDPAFILAVTGDLSREWTIEETLSFIHNQELLFRPGDQYFYSSTNFTILGRIIEIVTQKSLQEELNERFFVPLGMENTFVTRNAGPDVYLNGYYQCDRLPIEVQEYIDTKLRELESCDDNLLAFSNIPHRAAESSDYEMVSTLDDLIIWSKNLYGGNLIGPDQTGKMKTITPESGYYGMGTMIMETSLGTFYGHTGGGFGQARMWYSPEKDLSIVGWVSLESKPDFTWLTEKIVAILSGEDVVVPLGINDLVVSLKDENSDIRVEAANQLGQKGADAKDAIPVLIEMMRTDPSAPAQSAAGRALAFIGLDSPSEKDSIFSALYEKLQDETDVNVQKAIILAIGFIHHESSQDVLEPYLQHPNPEIAKAAQTAYDFSSKK